MALRRLITMATPVSFVLFSRPEMPFVESAGLVGEKKIPKAQQYLKALGHAILGNFSTDRMVIELTKISK